MSLHGRWSLSPILGSWLLLSCGCVSPFTSTPPAGPVAQPAPGSQPLSPTTPGAMTGPAPIMPLNLVGPDSPLDQVSLLTQKLAATDDDRKILAARLAQYEMLLADRERP